MKEQTQSNSLQLVDRARANLQSLLTEFSYSQDFLADINTAFGNDFNQLSLEQFYQQWQEDNFDDFPKIEIISSIDLNGANGAFSKNTNKIYLAQEFLRGNINNLDAISDVVLEEYGHYIDSQLNADDAPGDEGAIFAALVTGDKLTTSKLNSLREENDFATILLDTESIQIEQATEYFDENDVSAIQAGLQSVLKEVQANVIEELIGQDGNVFLSLVSDQIISTIENSSSLNIFNKIGDALSSPLSLSDNFLPEQFVSSLNRQLDNNGLGNVDINLIENNGDEVIFGLGFDDSSKDTINLDADLTNLGLPDLGISLSGRTNFSFDTSAAINFGVDVDTNEFFVDTDTEKEVDINLNLENYQSFKGKLGFFDLNAFDRENSGKVFEAGLNFAIDLQDDPNDEDRLLTIDELDRSSLEPSFIGELNVNPKLKLTSSLSGLPELAANLDFNAQYNFFTDNFVAPQQVITPDRNLAPTVELNDVTLDLSPIAGEDSFLNQFISPVNNFISPVVDKIDFLNEPISIIESLGGDRVSLLNIAEKVAQSQGLDFDTGFVREGFRVADDIKAIVSSLQSSEISLGSVQFEQNQEPKSTLNNAPVDGVSNLSGLSIPILETPGDVVLDLILGNEADLITYTLPALEFNGTLVETFPVLPPLGVVAGGNFNASSQLGFGFDTTGLQQGNSFEDGLFIIDAPGSEITVAAGPSFGVGLQVGVGSIGIFQGIGAGIGLDLNGINGKVRYKDIPPAPNTLDVFRDPKLEGSISFGGFIRLLGINLYKGQVEFFLDDLDKLKDEIQKVNNFIDKVLNYDLGIPNIEEVPGLILQAGEDAINDIVDLSEEAGKEAAKVRDDLSRAAADLDPTNPNGAVGKFIDRATGSIGNELRKIRDGVVETVEDFGNQAKDFIDDPVGTVNAGFDRAKNSFEKTTGIKIPDFGLGLVGSASSSPFAKFYLEIENLAQAEQSGLNLVSSFNFDKLNEAIEAVENQIKQEKAREILSLSLELLGGDEDNIFAAGSGNDTIQAGNGTNSVLSGAGDDIIVGGSGEDYFEGGSGKDYLVGLAENDTLLGGAGEDLLEGGSGDDFLDGGLDIIEVHSFEDRFRAVDDWALENGYLGAFPNFHQADYNDGRGTVYGTFLLKPEAADWIDLLASELGNPQTTEDRFRAVYNWAVNNGYVGAFPNFHQADYNDGRGTVYGTFLLKPEAADWIDLPASELGNPQTTEDRFRAVYNWAVNNGYVGALPNFHQADYNDGRGTVYGTMLLKDSAWEWMDLSVKTLQENVGVRGLGNDTLNGGLGNDTLKGGNGSDRLTGDEGNDQLEGNANNDFLYGEAGIDTLIGGTGEDTLFGGLDDDLLTGEAGNDYLDGGDGANILRGGLGDDTYFIDLAISAGSKIEDIEGNDLLTIDNAQISLATPAKDSIGLAKNKANLIIDLNQDGTINLEQDLTIVNYFDESGTGAGTGYIESVADLHGQDILNLLALGNDELKGSIVDRFFNPDAGVHFYTADKNESDYVRENLNNYQYEGESYITVDPVSGDNPEEVYRFFNSTTGVHLYTTDINERDYIIDNLSNFAYEDVKFHAYETEVEGSIPVHRFYEPTIGVHFYTPNEGEKIYVEENLANYSYEGIAYYAFPINDSEIL